MIAFLLQIAVITVIICGFEGKIWTRWSNLLACVCILLYSSVYAVDAVFSVRISSVAALCHFTACTSRQAWLLSHLNMSASPWLLCRDSQACFSHRGTNTSVAKKSPNQSVDPIISSSTVILPPKPPQTDCDIMTPPTQNCFIHISLVATMHSNLKNTKHCNELTAVLIIIVIYVHHFQKGNTKTIIS